MATNANPSHLVVQNECTNKFESKSQPCWDANTINKLYKTNVLINLKVNHNWQALHQSVKQVVQNECTNKFESKSQLGTKGYYYVGCTKRMY